MTQEIITITVGAGQARPRRRARKSRQRKAHRAFWLNVAKYQGHSATPENHSTPRRRHRARGS